MSSLPFPLVAHLGYLSLLGILSFAAIYVFFRLLQPRSSALPLPPGPKPLPLLGNLLDVPLTRQWLVYSQWAKRYGIYYQDLGSKISSIYLPSIGQINSFTVFGQIVVVINSLNVAREILDNRSAIYSDRPRLVMGGELCGWNRTTALTPYGPRFKEHRSLFAKGISANRSIDKYHSVMEGAAQSFASGLASNQDDLLGQIHL